MQENTVQHEGCNMDLRITFLDESEEQVINQAGSSMEDYKALLGKESQRRRCIFFSFILRKRATSEGDKT